MQMPALPRGLAASFALAAGLGAFAPTPALAAAVLFDGILDPPPESSHYFTVNCFDDGSGPPASLVVSVEDQPPVSAPFVSVQIQRGNSATNTTDDLDSDALPSPDASIDEGPGDYDLFVDKTGPGDELYMVRASCMTGPGGTGVETGTDVLGIAPPEVPALPGGGRLLVAFALAGLGMQWARHGGRTAC